MATEIAVKPVHVKSLELPKEVEALIQEIADEGPTPDLDTVEEFKKAAELLKEVQTKIQSAAKLSFAQPPQIDGSKVFAQDVDSLVYEYTATNSVKKNRILPDEEIVALTRRNILTGHSENIPSSCLGHPLGKITQIATDGIDVYLFFAESDRSEWKSGAKSIGKIVVNEAGERVIHYVRVSYERGIAIKGFTIVQGALLVSGTKDSVDHLFDLKGRVKYPVRIGCHL